MSQRFPLRDLPKYEALIALAQLYPALDITSVETSCAFLCTATDVYSVFDTHFANYGLSMGKFTVLMLLLHSGPGGLTPSDCADLAGVTRATVTGLLDGLAREGWIERKPHPGDRRRLIIALTDYGMTQIDQVLPSYFTMVAKMMQVLSEDERKQLKTLLEKLKDGASTLLATDKMDGSTCIGTP